MMGFSFLVAVDENTLVGNTGWAGAGLLGLVLSWLLFKHLPDLERSRVSERDAYLQSLQYAQRRFDDALHQVLQHCKEEIAVFAKSDRN